jgi:hypothetical protein
MTPDEITRDESLMLANITADAADRAKRFGLTLSLRRLMEREQVAADRAMAQAALDRTRALVADVDGFCGF